MAKQPQQQEHEIRENQPREERYQLRLGWLILPALLLVMYAFLKSISPVLSWNNVMDWLGVQNRERYTMLAILCLTLILITAIWRILRK